MNQTAHVAGVGKRIRGIFRFSKETDTDGISLALGQGLSVEDGHPSSFTHEEKAWATLECAYRDICNDDRALSRKQVLRKATKHVDRHYWHTRPLNRKREAFGKGRIWRISRVAMNSSGYTDTRLVPLAEAVLVVLALPKGTSP